MSTAPTKAATDRPVPVDVASMPGTTPRLVHTDRHVEDLADYRLGGGYAPLETPDRLLREVDDSGLRGRGGAGFPLGIKLRSVAAHGVRADGAIVVANGEEGEPASVKDRWLMRHRPHLVLDGLRLAAAAVGARRGHVYVSDAESASAIETAVSDAAEILGNLELSVLVVGAGYVSGEETAAIRAINGGPAKPSDKPPRPFEQGVAGMPTLVSNVETLAHIPYIARHGAGAFRSRGTTLSPGTFLATVTGAGKPPVLYEIPHGLPLTDLLALHGVSPEDVRGILMGGYFGGLLGRDVLTGTLDHESIRSLGGGLGCGAISLITDECPVAVGASVMSYFDRENAGQCGSCFNGTAAMAAVLNGLRDGIADADDLARLERWSVVLRGRGACATLDAATNVAATVLSGFQDAVADHRSGRCTTCAEAPYRTLRPFAVEIGAPL
ncbi:NADH-ubiquinone oxidoreductase-F iron-sulfur binding region domain-containing protein [Williamsia sp.]|uniref:NADH-ubiquinone oxidoreductase-F iron-sulfur binding region domain-containing protein n=1 Tax=Williamsia sp. TaxID=1872085 RepID=UPI002F929CED